MEKNNNLEIHVGEIEGTYEYYKEWKRNHPTYDTIVSDYLTEENLDGKREVQ